MKRTKPPNLSKESAAKWLTDERLSRWNHIRDRACVLSLTRDEAIEWLMVMKPGTFRELQDQVE